MDTLCKFVEQILCVSLLQRDIELTQYVNNLSLYDEAISRDKYYPSLIKQIVKYHNENSSTPFNDSILFSLLTASQIRARSNKTKDALIRKFIVYFVKEAIKFCTLNATSIMAHVKYTEELKDLCKNCRESFLTRRRTHGDIANVMIDKNAKLEAENEQLRIQLNNANATVDEMKIRLERAEYDKTAVLFDHM